MTGSVAQCAQELDTAVEDGEQLVSFYVGAEQFALDMKPVQEIIRLPELVRVPLAPPSLVGLANLRGQILPIVSLRRIFNLPDQEADDATRAIVLDAGHLIGFLVDRVSSVMVAEPDQIDHTETLTQNLDSRLLDGIFKQPSGHAIMILKAATVIEQEFANWLERYSKLEDSAALLQVSGETAQTTDDDDEDDDVSQLVSFLVADQEYAAAISSVEEIVHIPETIIEVPNCAPHMLGVISLREQIIPLVSLRALFSLPLREPDENQRIVVVRSSAGVVGIVTDSVSEVLRVPRDLINPLPRLMAGSNQQDDITSICRLDNDQRLVSIICVEQLFQHSAIQAALEATTEADTMHAEELLDNDDWSDDEEEDQQLVVFHLDGGEFGVFIDHVQEIVRVPEELTHVPKAPDFVEGVINLRGTVIPVIDFRKRLALPSQDRNERQRIIVFVLNGVTTGFIVDAVAEVMKIMEEWLEEAPNLSPQQAQLLGRVANLNHAKRVIQLVEPEQLFTVNETENLHELMD